MAGIHRTDLQPGASARLLRNALPRPRLEQAIRAGLPASALVLEAPPGYGKSVIMAQVRRALLSGGDAVAWISGADTDDADMVLERVAFAVRDASDARGVFAATDAARADSPADRVALVLEAWARLGRRLVLMVDDFDAIADSAAGGLILRLAAEAPVNGTIMLACRACPPELAGGAGVDTLRAADLTFTASEALELFRARTGGAAGAAAVSRLHETCEGWPAALDLAATIARQAADPSATVTMLSRSPDPLVALMASYVDGLPPDAVTFLQDSSALEVLHPVLCSMLTGRGDAGRILELCHRRTPLLVRTGRDGFLRFHRLARPEAVGTGAADKPELHRTAAAWLAEQGQWEAAANHALAAGDTEGALGLIDRVIIELITRGRFGTIAEWADRDPLQGEQKRRAAQVARVLQLAIDGRAAEAQDLAKALAVDVDRLSAELARSAAALSAFHGDDPDAAASADTLWPELEKLAPRLRQVGRNVDLWLRNAGARRPGPAGAPETWRSEVTDLPDAMGLHCLAAGLIDAAQIRQAAGLLGPALRRHEGVFGRRDVPANVLGATLAAALWHLDERDQARDAFAGRADLLERFANLPDALRLGFTTAARMAAFDGDLAGAIGLLDRQLALAEAGGLIRIQAAALFELVRLHAGAGATDEARSLERRLDDLLDGGTRIPDLYRPRLEAEAALARARVRITGGAFEDARDQLEAASRGRLKRLCSLEVSLVSAGLQVRSAGEAPDLRGLIELAVSLGCVRLLVEADPVLQETLVDQGAEISPRVRDQLLRAIRADTPVTAAPHGPVLTSKEEEILRLLASGLSNKDIARALEISAETVKWHVKNLGAKLDIGGRRGIVNRSRTLGLLEQA